MAQTVANIITWLLSLLTFLIGYIIGQKSISKEPLDLKLPKIHLRKPVLGAIPKLSQKEIEKKGTQLEATEGAMLETLDKVL